MKQLPKYIENALKRRSKGIKDARIAGGIIDDYAEKIGVNFNDEDACFITDIRIYCETDCAEDMTRQKLLKTLNRLE